MKTVVIIPGGFHPFHAGHMSLYRAAQQAFPDADVYVAATDDRSQRPFPFAIKQKLAQLSGVEPGHFVQVRSPFVATEITKQFDPKQDRVIFVRSEKDRNQPPQAGGIKKNGEPTYLQPLPAKGDLEPFGKHAYMTYLPTVEFGPGITSATEIRGAWPGLSERRKLALVMSLYPATQNNRALANNVVGLLDAAMSQTQESLMFPSNPEAVARQRATINRPASDSPDRVKTFAYQGYVIRFLPDRAEIYHGGDLVWQRLGDYANPTRGQLASMRGRIPQLDAQRRQKKHGLEEIDYIEERWSTKYKRSINCDRPQGFSQRAHCAGRKKK